MRLRSMVGAGLIAASLVAAGCTARATDAEAQAALQEQLVGLGFTDVHVVITSESDGAKVRSSPRSTRAATGTTSTTPKAQRTSAAAKTTTVTYRILSATASHPSLSCQLNFEQRLEPLGTPYFDEVMLPGTNGVEVVGEARSSLDPGAVVTYVISAHPECLEMTPVTPTAQATPTQTNTPSVGTPSS